MAFLPPTSVPTSFVPHPGVGASKKSSIGLVGVFGYVAYGVLACTFALALGVFFYGRVLASTKASKDAEIAKAAAALDTATVNSFVRLSDRLKGAAQLLDNHTAFSKFFPVVEEVMPGTIRFSSLRVTHDELNVTKFVAAGTAKSFNALAVASAAFANDARIRGAIFSNISLNKDGTVSFALNATLDNKVIAFSAL